MDHIHPISKFNKSQLKAINIEDEKILERWEELGNSLPNLQLLTSKRNNNKRAKPLVDYLEQIEGEENGNKAAFIRDNFLPKTDYAFSNFIKFYDKRKEDMIKRLESIFI
jgi:5-methylcytosine-specific restriction endonuclease McrA